VDLNRILYRLDQEELEGLSVSQTLDSGQHFRSKKSIDGTTILVNQYGVYRFEEKEETLIIYGEHPFDYRDYFDMNRDYNNIKKMLVRKDNHMKAAIELNEGLRILKQNPFEMIVTFIISQSKQIPQIKVLVERLAKLYGSHLGVYNGENYYSLPRPSDLENIGETEYRELKMGYRARYLEDAVCKVLSNEVDLKAIEYMPYEEGKEMLLKIIGVGNKVADCIMLFGYGRFEAFPVDVWIERIMTELYFEEKQTKKEIELFVNDYFGVNRGIAQQYLFEYARTKEGK
jgi:N-glycosylase/DNA lyase